MKFQKLSIILMLLSLYQCDKDGTRAFINTLEDAPETLIIEADTLLLKSFLWRNFSISNIPEEDSLNEEFSTALNCALTIYTTGKDNIDERYSLTRFYVVDGNSYWETDDIVRYDTTNDHKIDCYIADGPMIKTGTKVLIALEILNEELQESYLINLDKQEIEATYVDPSSL